MAKTVLPSIHASAFNCPHPECGALTTQFWFSISAERLDKESEPNIWTPAEASKFDFGQMDQDEQSKLKELLGKLSAGLPFLGDVEHGAKVRVNNLHVSRCYNLRQVGRMDLR